MAKILLSGHGTSRAAAALNTNTLHGLLKSQSYVRASYFTL